MAFNKQNISDNTATKITGASTASIIGMRISNTKSSGSVTIDLYIKNVNDNTIYYMLNNVKIPNGTTLFLNQSEIEYDNIDFDLYILSDSGTGDLSIITN